MRRHIGDVDLVLTIRRKIDFREDASARAKRKTGHMRELRARSRAERPSARSCIRPPHRLHGHRARGDHVLLDERRRYLQGGRDVVKPLRRIVSRQNLGGVEVDGKKIANSVRVFLAIEPMEHDLVTDMFPASGVIQRGLEPRDQRVSRGALRLSSAGWRHHASAQLAHGLLEHFGALADAVRGHALETDAADLRAIVVTANTVLRDGRELCVGHGRTAQQRTRSAEQTMTERP